MICTTFVSMLLFHIYFSGCCPREIQQPEKLKSNKPEWSGGYAQAAAATGDCPRPQTGPFVRR